MLVAPFALGFAAHPPAARRAAARSRSRATVTLGPFAAVDRWYREHSLRTRWQRDWPERIILIRHGESLGNTDKVHALSVPSRSDIHPEDSSPHTCRIKGFLRHVPAGALQQDSRLADRADRPRLRPGCARWHEAAQARRQRALLTRTPQGLRAVRTGWATRTSLLRAVRTSGAGKPTPGLHILYAPPYAYQAQACRTYRVPCICRTMSVWCTRQRDGALLPLAVHAHAADPRGHPQGQLHRAGSTGLVRAAAARAGEGRLARVRVRPGIFPPLGTPT